MKKYYPAFTLIELLVVIAIIGILASVIVVALGSSKKKATHASALVTMKSVQTVAVGCLSDKIALIDSPIGEGNPICAGGANYPKLESSWSYASATSDLNTGTFSILASSTDGQSITCDQVSCQ